MRVSAATRWMHGLLFRDLRLKFTALVLTAVLFVVTRGDVTRRFDVPLRVIRDSERVLMTSLPDTVTVRVRGPWTRVNRLEDYDLGSATVDLREAAPGPLHIDQASIVMPAGVVLADLEYDPVDLRFEPIIRTVVPVSPQLAGTVHSDFTLVSVEVSPRSWTLEGGATAARAISKLATEVVLLEGATRSFERSAALVSPGAGVRLVVQNAAPVVSVAVTIEPVVDHRTVEVPVAAPQGVPPDVRLPGSYEVRVRGPKSALRELGALGHEVPLTAVATLAAGSLEVRFAWSEAVPESIRRQLEFDPSAVTQELPLVVATPPRARPGRP